MSNLFALSSECLVESDLDTKIAKSIRNAEVILSDGAEIKPCQDVIKSIAVGRPEKPVLISPKDLPKRNITHSLGKAAMIHSFAHIEFNAITGLGPDFAISGYAERFLL